MITSWSNPVVFAHTGESFGLQQFSSVQITLHTAVQDLWLHFKRSPLMQNDAVQQQFTIYSHDFKTTKYYVEAKHYGRNISGNLKMWVLSTILCIKRKLPGLAKVSLMYFYPFVADYKIALV